MKQFNKWRPKDIKHAINKLVELGFDLDKNSARDLLIAINELILLKETRR